MRLAGAIKREGETGAKSNAAGIMHLSPASSAGFETLDFRTSYSGLLDSTYYLSMYDRYLPMSLAWTGRRPHMSDSPSSAPLGNFSPRPSGDQDTVQRPCVLRPRYSFFLSLSQLFRVGSSPCRATLMGQSGVACGFSCSRLTSTTLASRIERPLSLGRNLIFDGRVAIGCPC